LTIAAALVAGVVAALTLYSQFDEEIRCHIQARFDKHYRPRGLKVQIRSTELVKGVGIRVRGLSIAEPGAAGPHPEIFHVEEAMLECSTELKDLIDGNPQVRRVTIRRPTLWMTHRPDGSWSTAKLLPTPQLGDHPPEVKVEGGGVIEIFDPLRSPASTLVLRDVNLSLTPEPTKASPLPLEKGQREKGSQVRRLKGMFSGDGFRNVEVEGLVDLQKPGFSIRGQAEAVEISPELHNSLPGPLGAKLSGLPGLRGQANVRFTLSYDPAANVPLQYDVTGRFFRGRIDDARLPHAISDIRAAVHIDNGGFAIDDFSARSGQASLRMTLRRSGFAPDSPMSLAAELRQFDLDRALLDCLPSWAREQWYKYRPAGEVDADVKLTFDGRTWRPEAAVRCLNVSFTHYKLPLRLDHGRGTLDLKDDQLKLKLKAYRGREEINLSADVAHPFTAPTGSFKATGDNIQIDEALLDALPEKPREVARSLNPSGAVSFEMRIWRDRPDEPMHKHLQLALNRCSIRYVKFPYPISNIRGALDMLDGVWAFSNIDGNNDRARVMCSGSLAPGLQGNELVLNIVGRNVALGDELRDAQIPHIQQVWRDMRPAGAVDLSAEVRYLVDTKKFNVGVRIRPQPQSASIEPVHFPYKLDRLQGEFVYRNEDNRVDFDLQKGEHGPVAVSSKGSCNFMPDGRWNIRFEGLTANKLRADRDLIQALPERLRKAVVELNPTGTASLRGNLNLERTGRSGEPMQSRWDVRLGLQQSNVQIGGLPVESVHGEVALMGGFDGRQLLSRGELDLDSLKYKDCQFTQVRGPIWIDDGRVLWGACVDQPNNGAVACEATGPMRAQRKAEASLFGGKFYADGWATLGPEPRYKVLATLADADLAICARDFGSGRNNLRGKILFRADLEGAGRTRNALSGKGDVHLTQGNVYELPVMISLLKLLNLRTPDQNAFSDATINFNIEGEHIYLDGIDFRGDAISLRGKGEMDFQSAVKMTLYAAVGRGELDLPVVKQVFSGASKQIMLIHVDGTLQNPETRREVLPAVKEALQIIGGEQENRK
jgi:hypothetical protein